MLLNLCYKKNLALIAAIKELFILTTRAKSSDAFIPGILNTANLKFKDSSRRFGGRNLV
jgi:hypothetical protein